MSAVITTIANQQHRRMDSRNIDNRSSRTSKGIDRDHVNVRDPEMIIATTVAVGEEEEEEDERGRETTTNRGAHTTPPPPTTTTTARTAIMVVPVVAVVVMIRAVMNIRMTDGRVIITNKININIIHRGNHQHQLFR